MTAKRTDRLVKADEMTVTMGSGNVFEDLGFEEPAEALLKADLALQITDIINERGLTQTAAAILLGVDQPKVSALTRGRLTGFSIDRLVRYAAALGQEAQIVLRPRQQDALHHGTRASAAVPEATEEPLAETPSTRRNQPHYFEVTEPLSAMRRLRQFGDAPVIWQPDMVPAKAIDQEHLVLAA